MRVSSRRFLQIGALSLALGSALSFLALPTGADLSHQSSGAQVLDSTTVATPSPTAGPTETPSPPLTFYQLVPLIRVSRLPDVELMEVWTSDSQGVQRAAFLPGEALNYMATGRNNLSVPISVTVSLTQSGICGESLVFSDTLTMAPGDWQHTVPSAGLDCTGVYTTSTALSYKQFSPTLSTQHVVNLPSTLILSQEQGFDRCQPPTVAQMQSWWDGSPYSIFNLYLGGVHFFCEDQPLDAVWVHQVAQQGWSFILAWVGPQAPCTGYTHRMSWDAATAYLEGRAEASAAAAAARQLGLFGDQIIYYDMEAYASASTTCRAAVSAFMRGWTDQLNEQELKAGGYGGACSSYISDWAANDPPLEHVWIAHWYLSAYDPDATVWNTPCVSNLLWPDHQRIKQYAGGHAETWNATSLVIDSNVFDNETTVLPGAPLTAMESAPPVIVNQYGIPVQELGLFSPTEGWLRADGRLLRTEDGGASWVAITPAGLRVLGAAWRSPMEAWVVGQRDDGARLEVARTLDGGATWRHAALPMVGSTSPARVEAAFLEVFNGDTAWVALRLPSGSSFSLGRLFATQDGGRTWQERSLPIGAPVRFVDELHGWAAGGPAGNQLFRTEDGGRTWQPQALNLPPGSRPTLGRPHFTGEGLGRLPVVLDGPAGAELVQYTSRDRGRTWLLARDAPPEVTGLPEELLPAASAAFGQQFALPSGAVAVDFIDSQHGWVAVQQGHCEGEKRAQAPGAAGLTCQQHWMLLATDDGGLSWRELQIESVP